MEGRICRGNQVHILNAQCVCRNIYFPVFVGIEEFVFSAHWIKVVYLPTYLPTYLFASWSSRARSQKVGNREHGRRDDFQHTHKKRMVPPPRPPRPGGGGEGYSFTKRPPLSERTRLYAKNGRAEKHYDNCIQALKRVCKTLLRSVLFYICISLFTCSQRKTSHRNGRYDAYNHANTHINRMHLSLFFSQKHDTIYTCIHIHTYIHTY